MVVAASPYVRTVGMVIVPVIGIITMTVPIVRRAMVYRAAGFPAWRAVAAAGRTRGGRARSGRSRHGRTRTGGPCGRRAVDRGPCGWWALRRRRRSILRRPYFGPGRWVGSVRWGCWPYLWPRSRRSLLRPLRLLCDRPGYQQATAKEDSKACLVYIHGQGVVLVVLKIILICKEFARYIRIDGHSGPAGPDRPL